MNLCYINYHKIFVSFLVGNGKLLSGSSKQETFTSTGFEIESEIFGAKMVAFS